MLSLGVQIGRNGEQITLVDETGRIIRGELLLAVTSRYYSCAISQDAAIVVPVNSSSSIDRIAARYSCKVTRCKASETEIGITTAKLERCHTWWKRQRLFYISRISTWI